MNLRPVDAQPEPRETSTAVEPLVAIIGADGQSVLVPRSQAVGKRPASGREQGRPVTSGDAGRIAEFNTSLDDLKLLREAIPEGATGTTAWALSKIPNWMDPGIGTAAKQKQAVIDRVKQVIGKILEGGVLRLEDEKKYEKILPTIGDPPGVVRAKLDGLERAIKQRHSTFVDALSDAGYETGKYESRASGTAPSQAAPAAETPYQRYLRSKGGR